MPSSESPPTDNSDTVGITGGPDGALWFAESAGNSIGRITTSGLIAEFPLPTPHSIPRLLTLGADGAMWFTERADRIGRITMSGAIAEFIVPTADAYFFVPSISAILNELS